MSGRGPGAVVAGLHYTTRPARQPWMEDAECSTSHGYGGLYPDAWYPEGGVTAEERRERDQVTDAVLAVCRTRCAVRTQCLEYAMTHDEREGIWGGATEEERARLAGRGSHRRHKKRAAPAASRKDPDEEDAA